MAQSGYTPILIYASGTATNVPLAANLTSSASGAELALNYADGKLYYKDSGGVVQVLASKAGSVNVSSFSAGTTGFTPSTATTGVVTLAGTLITSNGGTGLSSYTAGDLSYYASGTALTKLAIGTNGYVLQSNGTAPTWVAASTVVGGAAGSNTQIQFNNAGALGASSSLTWSGTVLVTTGLTATGAILHNTTTNNQSYTTTGAGTITISSGTTGTIDGMNIGATTAGTGRFSSITNTGLTSGRVVYSTTGGLETDSAGLTFDGTNFATTGTITGAKLIPTGTSVTGNGMYLPATNALGFSTAGTNAVYIDASQNVGIGTSSLGNGRLTVQGGRIAVIGSAASNAAELYISNTDASGGTWRVGDAIGASAGTFTIYGGSAASVKMAIDSSGNVGIGVTPSAWISSWKALEQSGVTLASSSTIGIVGQNWYINSSGTDIYKTTAAAALYKQTAGAHSWLNAPSGTAGNAISFTQAMTLDASGNLLVGKTTTAIGTIGFRVEGTTGRFVTSLVTGAFNQINHTSGTGTEYAIEFLRSSATVGSITTTTGATLYNTISDQRLKENIVDAPEFGSVIDSLQVRSFDWKSSDSHQRAGFVAQELVTVAPEAVHQPADPEAMMAVDYSKLVPMLVKEIQSLRKRLTALEST